MVNVALIMLAVLGVSIAVFGIAIDLLLPGASPGFNLPQLIVVVSGLAISVAALILRQKRHDGRFLAKLKRSIVTATIVSLLTLLALEIVLSALGISTYFPRELPDKEYQVISWTTCDENGCRLNYEAITAACATGGGGVIR